MHLYKRSSFLSWLQHEKGCDVIPIGNGKNVQIKNHVVATYMYYDKHNRIDYDEIYVVCSKLMIVGLPGDKDLEPSK